MNKLKYLRESHGLTTRQLGEQLDIDHTTVTGYETGRRQPDIEMLKKLAVFFNVSADYLLDYIYSPSVNFDKINSMVHNDSALIKEVEELNSVYLKLLSRAVDDPSYFKRLKCFFDELLKRPY